MGDVCVFVCGSRQQAKAVFTSTETKTHLVPHHFLPKLTGRPVKDLDVFPQVVKRGESGETSGSRFLNELYFEHDDRLCRKTKYRVLSMDGDEMCHICNHLFFILEV